MSIAFNLNAGPLAQVGLEILSLPAAYHLATGAYGWFKARERSKSLQELLSVSGGQLVSTSSFSFNLYKDIRSGHTSMQGVVVQNQKVQHTSLPKGSTGIPENSGAACLRALTTGLLCLFSTEAIVEILQDLIPYALVQLDLEDEPLKIDDALLVSLKQWVSAVALEEDSDMFRKFMLETVAARQSSMTWMDADQITDTDQTSINEIPLIMGVLRWILTPLHQRKFKHYPSRSFKVWTVAATMEVLGFEVQADPVIVQTTYQYESSLKVPHRFGEASRVILVLTNGEETDPMPPQYTPRAFSSPRPQITVIRGIPWIAFRHLRGSQAEAKTQHLVDMENFSFKSARACFRGIYTEKQNVGIEIAEYENVSIPQHQKYLISEFSLELCRICGPTMAHFLPISPSSPGWDPSEIKEQMRTLGEEEECYSTNSRCKDNCYLLYAIVCGAIYGLCSNACFDNGDVMDEDSEIAFAQEFLFRNGGSKLKQWARTVVHVLNPSAIAHVDWSNLIFELFLGKDTETSTLTLANAPSTTKYINRQNPYEQKLLLGAQANGLAAVSDMLVKITTNLESFCFFHINRGQILSFPLTEDYYIKASSYIEPAFVMHLNPDPNETVLQRFDTDCSEFAMRLDVEPCWIDDPRTVQFVLRSRGVPIATLNILAFFDKMSFSVVGCRCQTPSWEVSVRTAEQWQLVSMYQLMRTRFEGMSFRRADVSLAEQKVLVDSSQSMTATIFAICILHSGHLCIATECLACAYKYVMTNWSNSYATMIIPSL